MSLVYSGGGAACVLLIIGVHMTSEGDHCERYIEDLVPLYLGDSSFFENINIATF